MKTIIDLAKQCSTFTLLAVLSSGALLMYSGTVSAGFSANLWDRQSKVTDSVTDNNDGTWTYDFTVHNTSVPNSEGEQGPPFIVDWELPWFGDAGIDEDTIASPDGWNYAIETIGTPNSSTGWGGHASWQDPADPFYAGAGSPFTDVTQVLHWYDTCWARSRNSNARISAAAAVTCDDPLDNSIAPGANLDGFGFLSTFGPTSAPYQASWDVLPVRSGDPAFPLGGFPNSPSLQIPEPDSLILLAIGAFGWLAQLPRRRS